MDLRGPILILLGVGPNDTEKECRYLAEKALGLRVFEDEHGKMNLGLMAYSLIRCCSTIHERGIARDWLSLVFLVQGRLWLQMDLPVSCKRLHP